MRLVSAVWSDWSAGGLSVLRCARVLEQPRRRRAAMVAGEGWEPVGHLVW